MRKSPDRFWKKTNCPIIVPILITIKCYRNLKLLQVSPNYPLVRKAVHHFLTNPCIGKPAIMEQVLHGYFFSVIRK